MNLANYASDVTSQYGEDGILEEILRRLGITRGWCVEFGAWDGQHLSNTWRLWHDQGWQAVLIEGDPKRHAELVTATAGYPVRAVRAMVGWEGPDRFDEIMARTLAPGLVAVLCIDIDGDDYHVWKAAERYDGRVVVIEHNPAIPVGVEYIQAPGGRSGSSALSLLELAHEKGYRLACQTRSNLILVREEDWPALGLDAEPPLVQSPTDVPVVITDYVGRRLVLNAGTYTYRGIVDDDEHPIRSAWRNLTMVAADHLRRRLGRL